MIKDYWIYEFSKKELIRCLLEGMCLNGVIALLFYNSFWALIPGLLLVWIYCREKRRIFMRKRLRNLQIELKEFLNALIAALQTGRSMENAFLEAMKDTADYVGKETCFILELKQICRGITVGEPLDKLLMDFAKRSRLEELDYFSEVFSIAKKSGGNLIGIMKNTIRMLQEKMDAEAEILTVLAEKQLEFQVMSVIPLGIIGYLRIAAGNLIGSLYHNLIGIAVMSVCLMVYGGCYLYGKRLLEIKC